MYRVLPRLLPIAACCALAGCARPVALGSDILWAAEHETGDVSEWTLDTLGGQEVAGTAAAVTVTTEQARSGAYAAKLTSAGDGTGSSARLWRESDLPVEAYYAAWYLLPRAYEASTAWVIGKFRTRAADGTTLAELLDLSLRTLPGGEMILVIFDHRHDFLQYPVAAPAPIVPVGRWFHLESFYRNANDDTGRLTIWIDGVQVYDIRHRTGTGGPVHWAACNVTETVSPGPVDVYVDDAVISMSRVGPAGVLRVR